MSLESILKHILQEADIEQNKITQESAIKAEEIIRQAQEEANILCRDITEKAKVDYESQKQRQIVHARLEKKKKLLEAKQELMNSVFKKIKSELETGNLKKQQVFPNEVKEAPEDIDFYLNRFRQDYEAKIAEILFS